MTRRETLLNVLRLLACAALSKTTLWGVEKSEKRPQSRTASLKSAGACFGGLVGIAATKDSLQDSAFAQVVIRNFNLLTASGMKWDRIHPGVNDYDFSEADWNLQFAENNGLRVHGHNLCWNSPLAYPAWFKTDLNRSNAGQILTDHISTVMRRYEGQINSWDVVNEPVVSWSKRSDGLYPGIWLELLGRRYIEIAFRAAAAADRSALRVLNIYDVEQETEDNEKTRRNTVDLLKELLSRNVPVQAVGIESHLDASQPLAGESLRAFISEIRGMHLDILLTELDVKENRATGDSLSWDQTVAQYYGDYLSNMMRSSGPQSVIFWSLKDRWERGKRVQGLVQNDFSPRLSYSAAMKALGDSHSC